MNKIKIVFLSMGVVLMECVCNGTVFKDGDCNVELTATTEHIQQGNLRWPVGPTVKLNKVTSGDPCTLRLPEEHFMCITFLLNSTHMYHSYNFSLLNDFNNILVILLLHNLSDFCCFLSRTSKCSL